MKRVGGYWLPAYDRHMSAEFARGDGFQLDRLREIIRCYIPLDRRTFAVDAGAHVGSWSIEMATWFEAVLAIEPEYRALACLRRNVADRGIWRVEVEGIALGAGNGRASLDVDRRWDANSGGVYVLPAADGDVAVRALDDVTTRRVDFLKLDVEGSEAVALRGARRVLTADRPIVMCEIKERLLARAGSSGRDVRAILADFGYAEVGALGADVVFAPVT